MSMSNNAKNIKIREIVKVMAGYPLRASSRSLENGDVAFLQLRHVNPGQPIDWDEVPRVELPSRRPIRFLEQGDVIFASRGTRNYAYAIDDFEFKAVAAPEFYVLKLIVTNVVTPKFLTWQLNEAPAQNYLSARAEGAAMKNIRRQTLENMTIGIPPLYIQQIIVDLYEATLAEKSILQSLIQNRENMLRSLAIGFATEGKNHD